MKSFEYRIQYSVGFATVSKVKARQQKKCRPIVLKDRPQEVVVVAVNPAKTLA